nr:MAG TPA: hypothetical protein [Caudoviricetes sp.]
MRREIENRCVGWQSLSQPLADSSLCRGAEGDGLPRLLRSLAMTDLNVCPVVVNAKRGGGACGRRASQ